MLASSCNRPDAKSPMINLSRLPGLTLSLFLLLPPALSAENVAITNFATTITPSHAIAMHGEPKYSADFKHFDYTSAKALKGGVLKQGVQGSFDSLNPFIAKGTAGDDIGLIYDSLTASSADEAMTQYGLLAETIEAPEDRSWVIFNLRKQARFHDGQPVTAEDVVFTFNLLMEQGSPFYRSYYSGVAQVEALNPHRVKFSFKPGVNRELALIVGQIAILPKHFWQQRDFNQSSLEIPLGSGPYKIISAEPGRSIVYQRVSDYWGKDLAVNTGLYNYDRIQLDYYKDGIVLLEALKAGAYDFRVENIAKQWSTGYDSPALAAGLLKRELIKHENPTGMQCFVMNLRRPLFQDKRVRQALAYAFDFEWSNKNLFYGLYARPTSFYSNSELAASGLPSAAELAILEPYRQQIPDAVFTTAFSSPQSDGSGHNRQNLRKAAALLKQAGWVVKNNQLVHSKTGEPFEIEFLMVMPSFERVLNPYSKALEKLGINLVVKNIEVSQYINKMRVFDFDMVSMVLPQSLSPGNEQLEMWGSDAADTEGSRNYAGIKNSVVDVLIELVISAPDRQQLITRTHALDRVLLHNHYVIPQWYSDKHRIAYWDKFSKPEISPKYDPRYSIGLLSWWIDPAKEQTLRRAKANLKQ